MNFSHYFPELRPWVESLVGVWPTPLVKPNFAHWEVGHIVSMFLLGGCLIITNLRLIGVGLTSEPASTVERNLRPWLNLAVFGVLFTGVLIGMSNAEKLYDSQAFLVKMISLVAAVIFTYLVMIPVAKADGAVGPLPKAGFFVALAIWLLSIVVFSASGGTPPGMIHVIMAGALVVFVATRGKARWVYTIGLALILIAQQIITHVMITDPYDIERLDPANIWFTRAEGLWVILFAAYQIFGAKAPDSPRLTRLVGYSTLLVWVTVAAAGRWIAYAS